MFKRCFLSLTHIYIYNLFYLYPPPSTFKPPKRLQESHRSVFSTPITSHYLCRSYGVKTSKCFHTKRKKCVYGQVTRTIALNCSKPKLQAIYFSCHAILISYPPSPALNLREKFHRKPKSDLCLKMERRKNLPVL